METQQYEDIDSNQSSPVKLSGLITSVHMKTVQDLSSDTTTESPHSKLSGRPNFNLGGLNVQTRKSKKGTLHLNHVESVKEPRSAILLTTSKKKRQSKPKKYDYLTCYENAEMFLDEKTFVIVEPGAETKVRKHIKVITRSQSVDHNPVGSPLYCGSPTLAKIGDSSLLARRANSRTGSPLLLKPEENSDGPINQHQIGLSKKVSRFAENESRRADKDAGLEEEKMQSRLKFLTQELGKLHFTNIDESPKKDRANIRVIQELSNEATPMSEAINRLSFTTESPRKSQIKIE